MDNSMTIANALADATDLFTWVMDCITSNPIMTTAFVVTVLVPAGIMVFHRLKNTV
jgi:hypothetical protein